MSSLFHPRVLAIVALLLGTLYVNTNYIAHHKAENPFVQLFAHLMPEPLITHGEGHGDDHEHGDHEDDHDEDHAHEGDEADHAVAGSEHAGEAHGDDHHAAGSPILSLPLPGFLGVFDMDASHDGVQLVFTNLQLFQVASILLIFLCFSGVPRYLRTGKGDLVSRLFAGFAHWVRDDVVEPVMGRELGSKWLPFFLSIFFFILFMNLMGLIPHGATATASVFVTGGLAMITFTCMLVFGMMEQGVVGFWKNLVPHVPWWLWPLMAVVELIGLVVKPVALMIRLFATMMGGHMVVLTFMGLIFFVGTNMGPALGWSIAPLAVGFAVFIMIIEAFVALLQAFIFTQLSVIFINASIHPEH